jgi:hypothetical protein
MTLHAPPAGAHLARPAPDEYNAYYERYISRVPPGRVLERLAAQQDAVAATFGPLDERTALHRYEPGKWSVKEVLGHLTDAERVFSHRALRFARADATPLPGFDENAYVPAAGFDRRDIASLLSEWRAVRTATLALFQGLDPEAWDRRGIASEAPASVRALAYMTAGHTDHHLGVLRERYGVGVS